MLIWFTRYMGNILTSRVLSTHIARFKQAVMAYFTVTACNSTGQATKTAESIKYAWIVQCAELENVWMQSQHILKHYSSGRAV